MVPSTDWVRGANRLHRHERCSQSWEWREWRARDYFNGGAGDDRLLGRAGDMLNGGTGADTFVLGLRDATIVEDFNAEEDIIELSYEGDVPILNTAKTNAGLTLLVNGEVVAILDNLETLNLADVTLVVA
jgi:Ca2+-binding RTX toxin-like protein